MEADEQPLRSLAEELLQPSLIGEIRRQYRLRWLGIHGASHWARVLRNGLDLVPGTGADPKVVILFSVFHDACRIDDLWDPPHGARGAKLASRLRGSLFELEEEKMSLLHKACRDHTRVKHHKDVTIQTCWDADRLDLSRIGAVVDLEYLGPWASGSPDQIEISSLRAREKQYPMRELFEAE